MRKSNSGSVVVKDVARFSELVNHLKHTVEEREQVAAAWKMRVEGPSTFGEVWWEKPSDIIRL